MTTSAPVYLSKKGMKELKKEIAQLERNLQQIQADLRELGSGDSREERFERSERLSRLEIIEAELTEKRTQLQDAKLLPRKRDALKVALGSVVDLLDTNGRLVRYTLVNSLEANPSDGRISIQSPLGRSLLGKSPDQEVEWSVGMRENHFRLVRIS